MASRARKTSRSAGETSENAIFSDDNMRTLKIDFRPFMHLKEITAMEFKEQRISILNHDAVIFTSKKAMDHYFGMCEKMRIRVPEQTKYFCVSEAIAHYLQNFIMKYCCYFEMSQWYFTNPRK